ncbi:hypothetical protein H6F43_21410 [Leptolyngbya sp. FACHB-36]|uniref:hypothetical protein n=1 Tax=Leptolyngbya sp. FACHB-36 TaxID=2692808 RepID=UPI001680B748|nr:hypothetical protein [Leptolyngbya sp. FACHB-36]MBD2022744.1 hypothetical protein [Leptolyngbya sp. FACHB-36]
MRLIICPGFHAPELTEAFLAALTPSIEAIVVPTQRCPPYSGAHILEVLHEAAISTREPLIWIGFSAGVVGAISAGWRWKQQGGQVGAVFAIDGWGVPLWGDFPIHRLSHDEFTHGSSALLGSGGDSFYADPPVEHLELWRSPDTAVGWWLSAEQPHRRSRTTAASFLTALLKRYAGNASVSVELSE